MGLTEKINFEFQCFYLAQMRTSKENIFAHSGEIEIKKNIRDELYELEKTLDESVERSLLVQNNLIESVYCFYQEMEQNRTAETMKEVVQSWLSFLEHKRVAQ